VERRRILDFGLEEGLIYSPPSLAFPLLNIGPLIVSFSSPNSSYLLFGEEGRIYLQDEVIIS
jgi:hypothetical protein